MDRNYHIIKLFELKVYDTDYIFLDSYAKELRAKMTVFQQQTKTRKQLFWTLLTTFGLESNMHSLGLIDQLFGMGCKD